MRRLFLKLKEDGRLIILASHNREDIEVLCDEVYEMENGFFQNRKKKGGVRHEFQEGDPTARMEEVRRLNQCIEEATEEWGAGSFTGVLRKPR